MPGVKFQQNHVKQKQNKNTSKSIDEHKIPRTTSHVLTSISFLAFTLRSSQQITAKMNHTNAIDSLNAMSVHFRIMIKLESA